MSEQAIMQALNSMSASDLANAKAHARQATDENHPSFKEIAKWTGQVTGGAVAAGLTWKVIKTIIHL
jgi:hypothetical protein